MGGEIASFLLGVPGGSMTRSGSYAEQDKYFGAVSIQDDWKIIAQADAEPRPAVRSIETPITERYNRSVHAVRARHRRTRSPRRRSANYARAPIPELPVSQFKVNGGLTFAGAGGNRAVLGRPSY